MTTPYAIDEEECEDHAKSRESAIDAAGQEADGFGGTRGAKVRG